MKECVESFYPGTYDEIADDERSERVDRMLVYTGETVEDYSLYRETHYGEDSKVKMFL